MSEVSNSELVLFNILEELYALNHTEWKRRVMSVLSKEDSASFRQIKKEFLKIPDMLVYRCLREMIMEGMIIRHSKEGYVTYSFTEEGRTLAPILEEVRG